jgi:hypothetical protein
MLVLQTGVHHQEEHQSVIFIGGQILLPLLLLVQLYQTKLPIHRSQPLSEMRNLDASAVVPLTQV